MAGRGARRKTTPRIDPVSVDPKIILKSSKSVPRWIRDRK